MVALESALITHGFTSPANLEIAARMAAAVHSEGAIPAVVAVIDGQACVGLNSRQLARLASGRDVAKLSLHNLPLAVAERRTGGTTVAASIHLAHQVGIRVFATGGIGGVHRDHPQDVSADLPALATTPIVVICSGAKAILDLPRTREYLETWGVAVVGYGTDEFPAFYTRESGLPVDARVNTPQDVACIVEARASLGLRSAILVCVPVPESDALPLGEAQRAIAQALREADASSIGGGDVTPYLLQRVAELTDGQAQRANEALLVLNARVAAWVSQALGAEAR